jgi:hypothetical protein
MASGIGAKALMTDIVPRWLVITTGSGLILFSVFCFGAAVWRHLYPGPPPPVPDARCRAHSSCSADFGERVSSVGFHHRISCIWFGYAPD